MHSATLSPDDADVWAMLVSSLSACDDGAGGGGGDDLVLDTTVVDLVDHFAVIDDPRHPAWIDHPLAAVLVLCSAAVVAGMRGFTAIAGWVTDTPPAMLAGVYARCGKRPELTGLRRPGARALPGHPHGDGDLSLTYIDRGNTLIHNLHGDLLPIAARRARRRHPRVRHEDQDSEIRAHRQQPGVPTRGQTQRQSEGRTQPVPRTVDVSE